MIARTELHGVLDGGGLLQEGGDAGAVLGIVAVVALVLLNGFFVATEFSMVSVRRSRVEQLAAEGKPSAAAVRRSLNQLDRIIAATQLGITIASLGLGWIGEPALAHLLVPLFEAAPLPEEWHGAGAHTASFIISFALITAMHILFGELIPKALALQKSENVAFFVAIPMLIFMTVFGPVVRLLTGMGNFILGLMGVSPAGEETVHSVEELRYLLTASRKAGVLEASEEEIAGRAFLLGDLTARRVMIPRTELVWLPAEATLEQVYELAGTEHHVRFPVYERDMDHVLGILHLPDVVGWQRRNPGVTFSARAAVRDALVVPQSLEGDRLLARMRKARSHTAIVVDEFGGVEGMITLQDFLERIVGEVPEASEDDRPEIRLLPDGSAVVDGLAPVAEISDRFGISLLEHEAETLGGYIMETLGRVPDAGEELQLGDYKLRIAEMDGPRIAQVVLSK